MDKEITIKIQKEDLLDLYWSFLRECNSGLASFDAEYRKKTAEQKDRIKKIIIEALKADGSAE